MTRFTDVILDSDDSQDYHLDHGLGNTLLTLYDPADCRSDIIRVYGDHDFGFKNHWFKRSPMIPNQYFEISEPPGPHINIDLEKS